MQIIRHFIPFLINTFVEKNKKTNNQSAQGTQGSKYAKILWLKKMSNLIVFINKICFGVHENCINLE